MDNKTTPEKLLHDLRNQLNNIFLNAELAKLELATESSQTVSREDLDASLACINLILEASNRCSEIVDKLADAPVPDTAVMSQLKPSLEK
tara:strand:+ start:205699 stop:205968 length:270 start_codon:yes stop_codon:yes gene_type:complete